MTRSWIVLAALIALVMATAAPAAKLTIGAGSSADLGTAGLDLGCADLAVAGTFSAGSLWLLRARDVEIASSGVMNGGSATIEVGRDWTNVGSFIPGSSTVRFVDDCGLGAAVIAGDTTFASLEITSTNGSVYQLTAGSTQTVTGSLMLQGIAGNLLQIRSTIGGSEAFLIALGSAFGDFVDVEDVHSTGNPIQLTNSITGSNTPGWVPTGEAVPVLSVLGLLTLAGVLFVNGLRAQRD